jgi:hypothetical protein
VLAEVQRRTADSMNRAADNFERYEAATNLHVPPELYLQQVRTPPTSTDFGSNNTQQPPLYAGSLV